ncbi:SusE domain-containing protein [Pontibacter sp. MBLB2868]|uniref:SusE domain-containing protein n=1 Tax=Pontibacter sp. MBLB2868 TaxID=3451555 RepID=UPI003F752F2B
MKNWLNKSFIFIVASLALMSCEKDEEMVFVSDGTAPALTVSSTSVELTEAKAAQEAVKLTWTPSDFGYQAAVNYLLEADLKGNNFATPVTMELGSDTEETFTVQQLNTLVNKLDIRAFNPNDIDMRIRASVSPNITPVYSNVVTMSVVPYLTEPPYATLYMVGDATDAGWDNTKAIAMLRDPADLFKFTYTGKFKADYFKFLGKRGSWAPMYGAGANNTLVFRETEADTDPASIQITSEGYKTVTVDLRSNTYTISDYNASAKPTYASIGIIGSFKPDATTDVWSKIVPMNKTSFNPHYWTIEYTFANDVEMKFRIEPNWDSNWGAPAGEQEKLFNKAGGENIKLSAGTYMIVFNDLTGNYLFIKK